MIRLDRLSKSFRGKPALHGLSLEIKAGEIFGLLGHNGAGKSTTFGLLLGQIYPTSGEAFIRDVSVQRDRHNALQKTGAIFEEPAFYDYLSGWNNLRIFTGCSAQLSDSELRETVGFVDLDKRINDPVRVYSHGMRQRLALAQALLPRPEVIFLDEPAEGLDPEGMHEMRGLIQRLNRERGMTVILSSHLLVEVEQLCDRIAILNRGRLVFEGPWSELGGGAPGRYRLTLDNWITAAPVFVSAGVEVASDGVIAVPGGADIADVIASLVHSGVRVSAVEPLRQSLEAMYLETISREWLFVFQLRNELLKLFARKRTYIGFGAFFLVETVILLLINLPKPKASFRRLIEQNGYGFDSYFSGLTLGLLMLMWTTFLLGALYLALVSGDVVSKEVEDGTMRMMLCRPISRAQLLMLKYIACIVYTFVLVGFIGLSALGTGILYRGLGGLFVAAPMEHIFAMYELGPGLTRYLCALPLLALCLMTITSLGFLFSCLNMKPAAATIVTLSIFFFDSIFRNIPYFESLQPYFLTTHMSAWIRLMESRVPWHRMAEDYAYLLAVDATFVVIALAVFDRRDFKA